VKLDWLDDGNLYLLLPDQLLAEWHGIDSDDYDRACAASDNWLNALSVGDGIGLVLGGDPGMALVVPGEAEEVALVRWVFADDENELVAFALRGEGVIRTEPDLVFDNSAARWRLFNAAADLPAHGSPSRRVSLPVGRLRVRTAWLEAGSHSAIIHRFRKDAEPGAAPDPAGT
jgi:hypothetical protein